MSAYLIAEITVTDPVGYEKYRAKVGASLSNYNAKFLVRAGAIENLEGSWSPQRLVICEFSDMKTIREWYASEEYQEIKKLRDDTAAFNVVSVAGI
ncbi:MAG: DUF1330 domain-containing protein [Betaproteobacteria bacterium]|jgi:uncharacterized protein (DUF1330 family)|nr:DUF1330 domain-containing protein [Betaproteobacteria bacterium]MCH1424444.1 DUF1330 domain-containing protein [Burkholderiales bacterium]MDA1030582.1 DUF1330 domain-containing protein [Pseudomonadota bacterium]MBT6411589.1 DUF1330 domain-containing protein [Betaproteobacteria bacterium]MBT7428025.1 DUF1330 domain-containing protein [Betaproteobacteria bacterium]